MAAATRTGRLRLVVIQALVFSLFATLFARLYYLQVVGGEEYHAQAASQSVREIVVQPQRGLIVDDMGRPLVANRTSWVVSVDRSVLGKLTEHQQEVLVERVAGVVDVSAPRIRKLLVTCGEAGSASGHVLERLAVPAGAGGRGREAGGRAADPRAARGLPRGPGRAAERPRLPEAVRHQPRARARLPQPDHRGRARPGPGGRRRVGQRRLVGRPGRDREGVRPLAARHARLQERRGRLDGPRARRRRRGRRPARRHPGHHHRRQGPGHRRAAARADHRAPRGRRTTRSPTRTTSPTRARSW